MLLLDSPHNKPTQLLSSFALFSLWHISVQQDQPFFSSDTGLSGVLPSSSPMATSLVTPVFELVQFIRQPHSHLCEKPERGGGDKAKHKTFPPQLILNKDQFPTLLMPSLQPTFPSPTPNNSNHCLGLTET